MFTAVFPGNAGFLSSFTINGNVLATFQMQHDSVGMAPGGLAEITPTGHLVRAVSDDRPGVDRRIRPYSAAIVPSLDRIVTTTTDMGGGDETRAIQIWRQSDLTLLQTIELPNGPHRGRTAGVPHGAVFSTP